MLPESWMNKIRYGISGTLFTEQERLRAWWIAYWEMYFPDDGTAMAYHRSWYFPVTQEMLIDVYMQQRFWNIVLGVGTGFRCEFIYDYL